MDVITEAVALPACGLPVLWVGDGVDDGVVDGRGLGDDGGDGVHVGSQHVCVPVKHNMDELRGSRSGTDPDPLPPGYSEAILCGCESQLSYTLL